MPITGPPAAAGASAVSQWGPLDYGFKTWSDPPTVFGLKLLASNDRLYFQRLKLLAPATITNIVVYLDTAGTTNMDTDTLLGLYSAAGARLAITATAEGSFEIPGLRAVPLITPYAAAVGDYYAVVQVSGSGFPEFARAPYTVAAHANMGLTAPNLRAGYAGTDVGGALPTNLAAQTSAFAPWMALS